MAFTQFHNVTNKILFYNLHDIICVKSDIDLGLPYFQCEESFKETDLIINTVDYKPINKKKYQRVASGLYYSETEDSIVSNMSILGLKVSWEIRNILSSGTELRVSKSYIFLSKYILVSPISSVHNLMGLFLMVLQIKMLLKNYSFLIGGCTVLNGKNIIFTGTGGSGKTLLTVNFVETYGADFMSDDFLIINQDSFYSYPTPLKFRKFNLDFLSYSTFINPVEKFKEKIKDQTKGDCDIYFLELSASQFIRDISAKEGIRKLCSLNNRALLHFNERILSYLPYIYDGLSLLNLQKKQFEILTDNLKNAKFFIISSSNTMDYINMLKRRYTI